jgi:hypothetical protein
MACCRHGGCLARCRDRQRAGRSSRESSHWRHTGFADAADRAAARQHLDRDLRGLPNAQHRVVVDIALLGSALGEGDLTTERTAAPEPVDAGRRGQFVGERSMKTALYELPTDRP